MVILDRVAFTLSPQQQAFIDYKALGGVVLNKDTDTFEKWTMADFSRKIGVDRGTLYNWRDSIPGFWDRVAERRKELNAGEWLSKLHEKWKLKALEFNNWQITEAWMINFDPTYKAPKLKVEHDVTDTMADALTMARNRRKKLENVQEGELVDGNG